MVTKTDAKFMESFTNFWSEFNLLNTGTEIALIVGTIIIGLINDYEPKDKMLSATIIYAGFSLTALDPNWFRGLILFIMAVITLTLQMRD